MVDGEFEEDGARTWGYVSQTGEARKKQKRENADSKGRKKES
jgi:hypothetical protein